MTYGAWICLLSPLVGAILILLSGTRLTRRTAAWMTRFIVMVVSGMGAPY